MMNSNTSDSIVPYLCENYLGNGTDWVALPVQVSARGQSSYAEVLKTAQSVVSSLSEACSAVSVAGGSLIDADAHEDFLEFETSVDFEKVGSDYVVDVYKYLIVELEDSCEFWQKMQLIAQFMDTLQQLVGKCSTAEGVTVVPGI